MHCPKGSESGTYFGPSDLADQLGTASDSRGSVRFSDIEGWRTAATCFGDRFTVQRIGRDRHELWTTSDFLRRVCCMECPPKLPLSVRSHCPHGHGYHGPACLLCARRPLFLERAEPSKPCDRTVPSDQPRWSLSELRLDARFQIGRWRPIAVTSAHTTSFTPCCWASGNIPRWSLNLLHSSGVWHRASISRRLSQSAWRGSALRLQGMPTKSCETTTKSKLLIT
jgi:hypothetical protein